MQPTKEQLFSLTSQFSASAPAMFALFSPGLDFALQIIAVAETLILFTIYVAEIFSLEADPTQRFWAFVRVFFVDFILLIVVGCFLPFSGKWGTFLHAQAIIASLGVISVLIVSTINAFRDEKDQKRSDWMFVAVFVIDVVVVFTFWILRAQ